MRKIILTAAGASALVLFACIVAPEEPATVSSALTCPSGTHAYNGACRPVCSSSAACAAGTKCMVVAPSVAVCLNYGSCAYLGSDTSCATVPYGGYGYGYGYASSASDFAGDASSPAVPAPPTTATASPPTATTAPAPPPVATATSGYPYGGVACAGNATWTVLPPTGDPECGVSHAVTRCMLTSAGCAIAATMTADVAEP